MAGGIRCNRLLDSGWPSCGSHRGDNAGKTSLSGGLGVVRTLTETSQAGGGSVGADSRNREAARTGVELSIAMHILRTLG